MLVQCFIGYEAPLTLNHQGGSHDRFLFANKDREVKSLSGSHS